MAADKVIAVDGVAKGNADRRVEILVHVPEGESASAAADKALEAQGAKKAPPPPVQQNSYSFTGLFWDVLPVVQNYNPAGSPQPGAQTALNNTYGPWSSVSGSNFRIQSGGTTTRCPSLVRECPGAQRNDRANDVGWARLSNGTLGVTWSTSGTDEADMAINTRYAWVTGCSAQAGVRPPVGLPARERPRRRPRPLDRPQRRDVPVLPDRALRAGDGRPAGIAALLGRRPGLSQVSSGRSNGTRPEA